MQDRTLRRAGIVFLVAVAVHGADHVVRGLDVITTTVAVSGAIQFGLGAAAVVLVLRGHPHAPEAAVAVGLPSALLFAAAHLLPQWSAFSDPYVGSQVALGVTAFSWFTAMFEIAADLAFAAAGILAIRARPTAATVPATARAA